MASVCPSRRVPYTAVDHSQTRPLPLAHTDFRLQTSPLSTSVERTERALSVSVLCTSPRTPFFLNLLLSNPTHSLQTIGDVIFMKSDPSKETISSLKKSCVFCHSQCKGVGGSRAATPSPLLRGSILKIFLHSGIAIVLLLVRQLTFYTMLQDTCLKLAGSLLTCLNGQPKGVRVILEWVTVRVTYIRH